MISQVYPNQLEAVWPVLEPMVKRGLSHGQGDAISPGYILNALIANDMLLWVYHEGEDIKAGMILEVSQFPQKRVVFVVLLIGRNMEEWVDEMESTLFTFQKLIDADCIEASCRDGLVKKLMERGWKRKATILEAPCQSFH